MSHFNQEWKSADCNEKGKALAAVEKETDSTKLADFAKNNEYFDVCMEAVKRLNDQTLLADVAINGKNYPPVCVAAAEKVTVPQLLADIAIDAKYLPVCVAAVEQLKDPKLLADIAKNAIFDVCVAVLEKLDDQKLLQIKSLQKLRGVIVFTDPDYPGQKIRQEISNAIPEVKHAYLKKDDARSKNGNGLGVEHATTESIKFALESAMTPVANRAEHISQAFLLQHNLVAHRSSKIKRERLAEQLGIGYVNGKQLRNRLNMFGITEQQVAEALKDF